VETVTWDEAAAYCNALSAEESFDACYECTGTGGDVSCVLAPAYATVYDCPGYRLPTEAEWEYAARAGTTAATYNGELPASLACRPNETLDPIAWWCGNAEETTHPSGMLDANAWGLYDMLGSVWEWCHDRPTGEDYPPEAVTDPTGADTGVARVARGGSWYIYHDAATNRAAARGGLAHDLGRRFQGFRPVRTAP
jgi:formylglycine-generating enzyme required for sulfatase activity